MPGLGVPEILVILMISAFWVVPLAASVWALLTLHRIYKSQQVIGTQLENIAHILRGNRQPG